MVAQTHLFSRDDAAWVVSEMAEPLLLVAPRLAVGATGRYPPRTVETRTHTAPRTEHTTRGESARRSRLVCTASLAPALFPGLPVAQQRDEATSQPVSDCLALDRLCMSDPRIPTGIGVVPNGCRSFYCAVRRSRQAALG